MKFGVRAGFVIHQVFTRTINDGTGERKEQATRSFYPGDDIFECEAEEAALHLHKLVPIDKAASTFLEGRSVLIAETPTAIGGAGISIEQLQAAVSSAVAAALAARPAAA